MTKFCIIVTKTTNIFEGEEVDLKTLGPLDQKEVLQLAQALAKEGPGGKDAAHVSISDSEGYTQGLLLTEERATKKELLFDIWGNK